MTGGSTEVKLMQGVKKVEKYITKNEAEYSNPVAANRAMCKEGIREILFNQKGDYNRGLSPFDIDFIVERVFKRRAWLAIHLNNVEKATLTEKSS